MKTKAILLTILICAGHGQTTRAQGSFQNLDFESADVSGYAPGNPIPVSAALPGWSVDFSPGYGDVTYDAISLGGAAVSVWDSHAPWSNLSIPDGDFCAVLFGGPFGIPTISQTGVVPAYSRSLQLDIGSSPPFATVSLGGQAINMTPLAHYSTYTVYGGDISSLAGQVATLSLTALRPTFVPPSFFLVDDIVFSPEIVPEPTAIGLFALAGLVLGSRFVIRQVRTRLPLHRGARV